jgi:hypothetical protein
MRNLFQETHASFKNFHRSLCTRFGYAHDERDWQRDQMSLEEHIAGQMRALKAENTKLLGRIRSMIDQTTPLVPVPGDPMWSRRITIDELRKALAECTASLEGEVLQKYHGQQPDDMHPVTRRSYDRDMAEIDGYKAISKETP